jgi:putative PIN family toxin of toxin-antitoxin system
VDRVTADSNIIISAFNWGGNPERLIDLARRGQIELAVSQPIIEEVARILGDKLGWRPEDVIDARRRIAGFTTLVVPIETVDVVQVDPSDNRVLECAVAASSTVLVTGDRHVLALKSFRGIAIVTVRDFLNTVRMV